MSCTLKHQAKEAATHGNMVSAQQKGKISLGLNITAVVCGILFYVFIVGILIFIIAVTQSKK